VKTKPFKQGYDLVLDALCHGYVDLAFKIAEDLTKSVEVRKDQTPPAEVVNFVQAFKAVAPKIQEPLPDAGEAQKWQERLQAAAVEQRAHYAMVTWGDQSAARDTVKHHLDTLESNYKAFYLYFALAGQALKTPDQKLTVVLADKASDLPRLRDALDGNPILSDSFYSPTHNVVVLSPERMDDVGRSFSRMLQTHYRQGWVRDELLKGVGPLLQKGEDVMDVVQAMTLGLVDKAVDDETVLAMVSREGSRQLFAASGLLPQHVVLPEWTDNGAADLLQKPKGPIFHQSGNQNSNPNPNQNSHGSMTIGIGAGYGKPNYVLFRSFREMDRKREWPAPEVLLMNTLTDKYFDAQREEKDIDPRPKPEEKNVAGGFRPGFPPMGQPYPPPGGQPYPPMGQPFTPGAAGMMQSGPDQSDALAEKRNLKTRLEHKAQSTSWALTYYLAKRRMPQLLKLYEDFGRMPRDMRLDHDAVVLCFCRAMDLMDAANPSDYDKAKFKDFAEKWVKFLREEHVPGHDVNLDAPSQANGLNGGPMGPGGYPMGPGGSPMGPGGNPMGPRGSGQFRPRGMP
jgi:hypothetical protein